MGTDWTNQATAEAIKAQQPKCPRDKPVGWTLRYTWIGTGSDRVRVEPWEGAGLEGAGKRRGRWSWGLDG